MASQPTESTALLSSPALRGRSTSAGSSLSAHQATDSPRAVGLWTPFRRLVCTAFLLSMSFFFTASTLYISMRSMACELYYEHHPPFGGQGDRCSIREVESRVAREISWMVTGTTVSGLLNLLWTGWVTRKFGVKFAMIMQTTVPAFRNLFQQYAVYHGGLLGIRLLQTTQLITMFGGGAGYMLTANTYTAQLVSAEQRTASFGILQGTAMLGMSLAFTLGGLTTDYLGPLACFQVTLGLLVASSLMSLFNLPYIAPPAQQEGERKTTNWLAFAQPLRVFVPRKLENGARYYGLLLLGIGIFGGVLAGRFVPTMLQLHSTNQYGFGASENGYLMSLSSLMRALFLTLIFPRLIALGRAWYSRYPPSDPERKHLGDLDGEHIPPAQGNGPPESGPAGVAPHAVDLRHGMKFDLAFVRGSMLLDGVLTGLVGLWASKGWHMYLAAGVLPFASGTAPAGKGVVMELVSPSQRSDALAAIALVETLAGVTTVSLFGALFSYLSEIGKPETVFMYNAAVAMLSAGFLLLVRFPPRRSAREAV